MTPRMLPAREPPAKRRRIASHTTSKSSISTLSSDTGFKPASTTTARKAGAGRCSTCHRAVGGSAQIVYCARCEAPTCPVCTRTCTAVPPTREPTPALSFSSSTSPPTPTPSPRRAALSLATNTNETQSTARRRKHDDDDEGVVGFGKDLMDADGWTQGCGRVVCRACCTESIQSCTVTCRDCLLGGHSSAASDMD